MNILFRCKWSLIIWILLVYVFQQSRHFLTCAVTPKPFYSFSIEPVGKREKKKERKNNERKAKVKALSHAETVVMRRPWRMQLRFSASNISTALTVAWWHNFRATGIWTKTAVGLITTGLYSNELVAPY